MRPSESELLQVFEHLRETLGVEKWWVGQSRNGARAQWRWLSVTIKHKGKKNPEQPWRVRLRDGFPRSTVVEHWVKDPIEGLEKVVNHARQVRQFVEGESCLVRNPSKSWLAHRMWEAVRPAYGSD